jgi:Flp pilus assembly protein TadG
MTERGQASVETVAAAMLLALCALGVVQLVLVFSAAQQAGRIADQASVLVAERRPIPQRLTDQATVVIDGDRVKVTVDVPALPGLPSIGLTRTARLP